MGAFGQEGSSVHQRDAAQRVIAAVDEVQQALQILT
jgi:hypothetical protein